MDFFCKKNMLIRGEVLKPEKAGGLMAEGKKLLMVVDDNYSVTEVIVRQLRQIEIPDSRIVQFGTPTLVMEELLDPDKEVLLAILDYFFCDSPFTGLDLVEYIHHLKPSAGIILVAGRLPDINLMEARKRGVDVFLEKPFKFENFKQKVTKVLAAHAKPHLAQERS